MKLLKTGQLSGVTGNDFSSGVSTTPIYLGGGTRGEGLVGVLCRIYGDTGREYAGTGSSVAIRVKFAQDRGGPYGDVMNDNSNGTPVNYGYVVKSGASEQNSYGEGTYYKTFNMLATWMKIHGIANLSVTTRTTGVTWAVYGI
jgi:hypothetical protein